jgi:hypothetical protein
MRPFFYPGYAKLLELAVLSDSQKQNGSYCQGTHGQPICKDRPEEDKDRPEDRHKEDRPEEG